MGDQVNLATAVEFHGEIAQLQVENARLRTERDKWMELALAHEQVAADLRIRILEAKQ